jgi:hypothetical protein
MPTHGDSDSRALRALLTALLAAGGLAVHLMVQRLAPAPIAHPNAGLQGWVPFLPWTIWIYLSFFPLLVAAGVLVPAARWWRLVLAWAMASVTSWLLVLAVPVTFPRPAPTALGALHGFVFGVVHGVDSAHVTFPCLHAAVIWIAWLALRDQSAGLRAGGLVVAAAITLSTMTTRQHLVTDNLAGLAIAWASARVALPLGSRSRAAADQAADPAPEPKAASGSRS